MVPLSPRAWRVVGIVFMAFGVVEAAVTVALLALGSDPITAWTPVIIGLAIVVVGVIFYRQGRRGAGKD